MTCATNEPAKKDAMVVVIRILDGVTSLIMMEYMAYACVLHPAGGDSFALALLRWVLLASLSVTGLLSVICLMTNVLPEKDANARGPRKLDGLIWLNIAGCFAYGSVLSPASSGSFGTACLMWFIVATIAWAGLLSIIYQKW